MPDAILRTLQLNMQATQKLVIPVEAHPQSGVNSGGEDDSVKEYKKSGTKSGGMLEIDTVG